MGGRREPTTFQVRASCDQPRPCLGRQGRGPAYDQLLSNTFCRMCSWRALETQGEDRVPSEYKHAELQVCVHKPMSVHLQCALGEEGGEEG